MGVWLKVGLIFAILGFLITALLCWLLPICLVPVFILMGLVCGVITGFWLNTSNAGMAAKEGVKAGLLTGLVTFVTHILLGGIYFYFFGQKQTQELVQKLGWSSGSGLPEKIGQYVGGALGITVCGATNVFCFIGFSALGAFLVSKFFVKK